MKSIIFSISILAALTAADPVDQGIVQMDLLLDSYGSSNIRITVPFGRLFNPSYEESGFALHWIGADEVAIEDPVCQAFQDAAGTILLGEILDQKQPVTNISTTLDAVFIGSILCSDAKTVQARIDNSTRPTHTDPKKIALVELDLPRHERARGRVPLDDSIVVIRESFGSRERQWAISPFHVTPFVVKAAGAEVDKVSCQAYKDEEATQELGKPFSGSKNEPFPVPIGSLKCKII